jgi:hypothetical protein
VLELRKKSGEMGKDDSKCPVIRTPSAFGFLLFGGTKPYFALLVGQHVKTF